jgi:hypothetical protein
MIGPKVVDLGVKEIDVTQDPADQQRVLRAEPAPPRTPSA